MQWYDLALSRNIIANILAFELCLVPGSNTSSKQPRPVEARLAEQNTRLGRHTPFGKRKKSKYLFAQYSDRTSVHEAEIKTNRACSPLLLLLFAMSHARRAHMFRLKLVLFWIQCTKLMIPLIWIYFIVFGAPISWSCCFFLSYLDELCFDLPYARIYETWHCVVRMDLWIELRNRIHWCIRKPVCFAILRYLVKILTQIPTAAVRTYSA